MIDPLNSLSHLRVPFRVLTCLDSLIVHLCSISRHRWTKNISALLFSRSPTVLTHASQCRGKQLHCFFLQNTAAYISACYIARIKVTGPVLRCLLLLTAMRKDLHVGSADLDQLGFNASLHISEQLYS